MLWLAVTADQYELPIAVADSIPQLAQMLGMHKGTLYKTYSLHQRGILKEWAKYKIVKVEDEDGIEDEPAAVL